MKTFTNCAEKKAKQILNLLQGYTKGIRMTVILVLLLMGVSNAWAWDYPVGSVVYFEKPNNWSNAQFMIGHDGYSAAYNMTAITNTKLYRYQHTGTNWNGYGAWAVVDAKDWPAESNKIANRVGSVNNYIWYNEIKKYTLVQSNYAVSNNTSSFTSLLNKTQTITIQNYNTSNKKFEASNNTAGSVTAKYYAFSSSATSVGNQASTSITNSSSISAAYTSTVTLTASAKSGYQFVGWYDGTTLLSNNTTYSHIVPNSGKTIYARFIKTDAINTPVYLKTGDWKNDNARFAVYAFENTSGFQMWIDMSELDCSGTREYFTCKVPSNTTVILCRLNPDGSDSSNGGNNWTNKWGQTKDLIVGANNYWKFTGWDSNSDGNDEGTWTAYTAPTYTVTLVADSHGTYNVKSGNTTMTSKLSGNVTMNVALNSKITITTNTPQPGYDQSQGATITIGKNDKQKATLGTEYTICGSTTITGNFVTTEEQTVYLQPTGHWNGDNAQYKAFVFHDTGSKWMTSLMNNVTCETDDQACYTCTLPAGYNSVIFCRVKDNTVNSFSSGNLWNQTYDLAIPVNSDKNCYKITNIGDSGEKSSGNWKTFTTPTYNVTIKPTIYGTYSVVCNGRIYLAPNKEEIVIPNVPVGTTLTIQDVKPNNETEYTSDIIYKESANAAYQTLVGNQITVCGNTTIDENFVTKNPHTVYLRVPTTVEAAWNDDDQGLSKGANCVYYTHIMAGGIHIMNNVTNSINGEDGYSYYQLTIPAGYRTFCFQRKSESEPQNYVPRNYTKDFTHILPFINGLNCFTILGSDDDDYYYGEWGTLLQDNDYRLLYIEQKVEEENGHPKTIVTKAHPSDIIKYNDTRTTYSLHIYNEVENGENGMNDPEILVQQWNGSNWITKERHMVFGPLHAGFDKAAMPGRRDAAGDPAVLRYDNGIENIKSDDHADNGSGVWNFFVTRDGSYNFTGLNLTDTKRYTGEYYVRTDCADGGWDRYTVNGNHMTRSDISKRNSNYSHYFCKWVGEANVNVKYTIANDYGIAISDTLEADKTDLWGKELATKMVDDDQLLPAKANVRFSWNEKTNGLHRAYIAGATNAEDRFLVLGGKTGQIYNAAGQSLTEGANNSDRYGLKANEEIFSDIENWVYQTDVQITPGAELQVTAKYNNQVQYFVGKEGVFNNTILQGSGTEKYLVRLLYDFKTNELISAYVPGASTHVDKISTNLMLIRQNYNEAKQLVFNNGDMSTRENRKAYGVIEFTEDYLTNEKIPYLKRCLYWVSFPFDVNLSEAFGSLVYGKHWLIQEYDGARRAAEGLWKESESFWKLHWEPNITLEAGLGYVIEIDINQMIKDNIIDTKDAKQQIAALYFPSNTPITREIINQASYTVNIPDHKCEIVHTGEFGDRTIRDSHWNVIGVPSYVNTGATFSDQTYALNNVVKYYYQWEGEVDKYTAMEADEQAYDFQSMYAYMVQYAGDITWNSVLLDEKPAPIAAKKNSVTNEHAMRLELQQNNILLDKTFVRLQDDVATPAFDFNYDLCKITNKGANIYSIITEEASPVEVAANVLPIKETIIPIGIKLDAAGEYTFAMPDGTDGIVVELIDYEANTTTNLLFSDYTVSLPKGTNETRFALSVKPDKTATSLENIFNEATGDEVKKFIIDGVLYMQKDGVLYDAQGHIVR